MGQEQSGTCMYGAGHTQKEACVALVLNLQCFVNESYVLHQMQSKTEPFGVLGYQVESSTESHIIEHSYNGLAKLHGAHIIL